MSNKNNNEQNRKLNEAVKALENAVQSNSHEHFTQAFSQLYSSAANYVKNNPSSLVTEKFNQYLNPCFKVLNEKGSDIRRISRSLFLVQESPAIFSTALALALSAGNDGIDFQAATMATFTANSAEDFASRNIGPLSQFLLLIAAITSIYSLVQAYNNSDHLDEKAKRQPLSFSELTVNATAKSVKAGKAMLVKATQSEKNLKAAIQKLESSDTDNIDINSFAAKFAAVYEATNDYRILHSSAEMINKFGETLKPWFDLISNNSSNVRNLNRILDMICFQPTVFAAGLAVNMAVKTKDFDLHSAMLTAFMVNSVQNLANRELSPTSQALLLIAASKSLYSLSQAAYDRYSNSTITNKKPNLADKIVDTGIKSAQNTKAFLSYMYNNEVVTTKDSLERALFKINEDYSNNKSLDSFSDNFAQLSSAANNFVETHSAQETAYKFGQILAPWLDLLKSSGSDIRNVNRVLDLISNQPSVFACVLALNAATKGKDFDLQSPMMASFLFSAGKELTERTFSPISVYLVVQMAQQSLAPLSQSLDSSTKKSKSDP